MGEVREVGRVVRTRGSPTLASPLLSRPVPSPPEEWDRDVPSTTPYSSRTVVKFRGSRTGNRVKVRGTVDSKNVGVCVVEGGGARQSRRPRPHLTP